MCAAPTNDPGTYTNLLLLARTAVREAEAARQQAEREYLQAAGAHTALAEATDWLRASGAVDAARLLEPDYQRRKAARQATYDHYDSCKQRERQARVVLASL